jgi:hypothetical protein
MIVSGYSIIIPSSLRPRNFLILLFREKNWRLFAPQTHDSAPPHNKASPRRLDFSASRPPSNRPATTPPSQQGKRRSLRRRIRHWNDIATAQIAETTRRILGGLSFIFPRIPTLNLSRQFVELKKLGGECYIRCQIRGCS